MDDDARTAVNSRRRVAVGDLYGIRYGSDAQITNDGSRVAFVLTEVVRGSDGYMSTVCEVDREGKSLARIESGTIPRYAADSQALVVARGSELWLVGGTSRLVGRLPGTIREIAWCPVGGKLAVIADVPVEDHAIASTEGIHHITRGRYRTDGEGFDYGHRTQVLVVDLQSGAVSPVTHEQFGATGVTWSPDGERLAYIVPVGDPDTSWEREITVHSLSTGQRSAQWHGVGIQNLVWAPGDDRIAFRAGRHPYRPYMNFDLWTVAPGEEARNLTRRLDRFVGNDRTTAGVYWGFQKVAGGSAWHADGNSLVFIVADHGRNILYEVSTEMGRIRELEVPSGAVVFDFSVATGTGEIASTLAMPDMPTEIWLLPSQRRITHLNDKFTETLQMSLPHRVTWRPDDGPELEGWVYLPTTAQRPAPLILWVHGGPYRQHSSVFSHELQVLTGRGYAVFCPNPRGSQGYGEEFAAAIDNDWGNKDYTDLMSGLDYVVARGFGDPHNLGVMGGSYGGYMVNWMVTHTDRFRAAVSDRSLSDLPSYLGMSDGALSFGRPAFGSPWDSGNVSNLRRQSPVMYASSAHTPTLLMQAMDDDVAPVDQGRQFYLALWENGCETELVLFPGSCHNLPSSGRPSLRERRMEWTIAWFDAHMSGAVAF